MIREATFDDIPKLLEMAERFIALAWGRVGIPFDGESCERVLRGLIDGEHGILLVDEPCKAMIGALVHTWHFNVNILTATELFWWAEPESKSAMALWQEAEKRAEALGATTFNMGLQNHLRAAALGRLYERRGYTPSEHIFITELG